MPSASRLRHASRRRLITVSAAVLAAVAACRGGQSTTPKPAARPAQPGAPAGAPGGGAPGAQPPGSAAPVTAPATGVAPSRDSAARPDTAKPPASAAANPDIKPDTKAPAKKAPPTTRNCVLDFADSPVDTRLVYQRLNDSVSNTFVGGGFIGRCQGENNKLRADSAEQFSAAGIINLFGNVVYEEPKKMQITALHAVYFSREGRLFADGNVVVTELASGSTFSGNSVEYYRATPTRPLSRMVAPQRSYATLIEKDSTGKSGPPTQIQANQFEYRGDSLVFAWGDVVITRQQIVGRSDSAAFDKITEQSRLIRTARIVSNDTARRFTLNGDTIDLFSTNRQLDRVVARHKGHATTRDMQLDADNIDLRLRDQQLTEAFAYGQGRAKATTPQQDVDADSLRIRMADKVVRQVHAIGSARAIGTPDTLKMRTKEKDLLRGDSIFAYFDSSAAAVKDTTKGPPVKEIRAIGSASSLFHMASSKGRDVKPGINYVRGVRINVHFDTGTVHEVRVDSAASGVYIEPEDSTTKDSLARKDSAAAKGAGKGKNTKGTTAKPATTPPAKPPGKGGSGAPDAPAPGSTDPDRISSLALTVTRRRYHEQY